MTSTIRLFLHQLAEPLSDDATLPDDVPPEDLARARRFHFAEDRWRWLAGRAWIRRTLASVLDTPSAAIAFSLGPNGKPSVIGTPPGFDCNWSHSGNRLALAVSDSAPVGVDLEILRDGFPALDVAQQFFTPTETAALEQTDALARQKLFLRLWTAKEALMKATGAGVSLPPDEIEVTLAGSVPAAYATHPDWQLLPWEYEWGLVAIAWPVAVSASVETLLT